MKHFATCELHVPVWSCTRTVNVWRPAFSEETEMGCGFEPEVTAACRLPSIQYWCCTMLLVLALLSAYGLMKYLATCELHKPPASFTRTESECIPGFSAEMSMLAWSGAKSCAWVMSPSSQYFRSTMSFVCAAAAVLIKAAAAISKYLILFISLILLED